MPIWCCRTRPISSARTASRCSIGRSREADGPADAIRQPVVEPDRDVRPFQAVLLDLGARLGLPGMTTADGTPRYPAAMPITSSTTSARRASARSPAGAARTADRRAAARPIPNQLERYIDNGCYWYHELPRPCDTTSTPTATISTGRVHSASSARPIRSSSSSTASRCRNSAWPRGPWRVPAAGRSTAQRIETYFDPLPFWYPPFEEALIAPTRLSAARHHPAADGDVSFLGLAERLAAADPRPQLALSCITRTAAALGPRRWRLGVGRQPHGRDQGADQADGRRQPRHRVDLECDRQAPRRLEPGTRRARMQRRASCSIT